MFQWYARVESNHRTRLRRPLLYPLSYGRVYRTNVIIAQGVRRCNPLFLFFSRNGPVDGIYDAQQGRGVDVGMDTHTEDVLAVRLLQFDVGNGL